MREPLLSYRSVNSYPSKPLRPRQGGAVALSHSKSWSNRDEDADACPPYRRARHGFSSRRGASTATRGPLPTTPRAAPDVPMSRFYRLGFGTAAKIIPTEPSDPIHQKPARSLRPRSQTIRPPVGVRSGSRASMPTVQSPYRGSRSGDREGADSPPSVRHHRPRWGREHPRPAWRRSSTSLTMTSRPRVLDVLPPYLLSPARARRCRGHMCSGRVAGRQTERRRPEAGHARAGIDVEAQVLERGPHLAHAPRLSWPFSRSMC